MDERPFLTFQQSKDVVEFSQALYGYGQTGFWSPYMSNALLQDLNNNPEAPTSKRIKEALANYRNSSDTLQGYMEFMQFYDMIFARTLQAYCNALSFDLTPVCVNANKKSDYESPEFIADKQAIYNFLNKFRYKDEFQKVVKQLITHEVYYVSFRKTKWGNKGMKFALQILPQDRCMLTGYWEKGLLFDFDVSYFLNAGTDLYLYDPSMIEAYNRVFGEGAKDINYRPSVPLNERTGTFAMYTQLSPTDGYWAFKQNPSTFNTTPFLAPFLSNAISNQEIAELQYNKDMASAYAILTGEIKLYDNARSGTKSNQFAIDPAAIGGFMQKAKAGLGSLTKLAAMPLENTKFNQFQDNNTNMYSNQLATSAGVGSGISRVIYSSDRQSNAEIEAGLNDMYQTMRPLYAQFSNFMEYYANKLTKKYKWRFVFDGSNYPFERKNRFSMLKDIADKGVVLPPPVWASVLGYEPQLFESMLAESKYSGWVDNYSQLLLNTNVMPQLNNDDYGGRPKKEDAELTDSGEANRDQ